jgi:ferredoxin
MNEEPANHVVKPLPRKKVRWSRLRGLTGVVGAWVMNLAPFGVMARNVCAPGFNCHGCPWATAACPVGVLAFSSSIRTIPVMAVSMLLAIGVGLGRLVCGFICPFGWFQDLVHRFPSPRLRLPRWTRLGKYLALLLLVFICPFFLGMESSGYLQVSKPKVDKEPENQLRVTITVKNLGPVPISGVNLVASYMPLAQGGSGGDDVGGDIFSDEDQELDVGEPAFDSPAFDLPEDSTDDEVPTFEFDPETVVDTEPAEPDAESGFPQSFSEVVVAPGEEVVLPSFVIPNRLSSANLTVTSPQSIPGLTTPYDLYYCKICPTGTLTAHLPRYFQPELSASGGIIGLARNNVLRLSILGIFLIAMVLVSRPFCQTFCPLGAIYGLLARLSIFRMRLVADLCIHCGACDKVCPVDLDVRREVGGPECISCGDCRRACSKNALERKFGLG